MTAWTEERRLVTSLFIDVVGSTELTARLGPERMKAALAQAFAEVRDVIEHEGGTVEKYIGDAIYALFGAPVAHSDDTERALRAASAARAWAKARADAATPFEVRIGVETGEAIVDLAATKDTRQQMSVGTVVNTAARLQQRAEPGQILVGPVAHDATSEIATYTALGAVDIKGLGPTRVWQLDELIASRERRRLPFVGRQSELELLRLAERRARTRSVLALISGPPGQGKTRLVEEFVGSLDGWQVLSARCRPEGEVDALTPLRELVASDGGMASLERLVGEAIDEPADRVRVIDALAQSAGLRVSAALASIGRDEREDEQLNAWRRLVRGLSARGPIALWIEDVHWAAPEVVRLIDRLSLSGEPLLVIATARPEFAEEAGIRPSGDRFFIELDALDGESARHLAVSAGRGDDHVITRAGGNPLFIVELARARDPSGELPLTLQGALGARLDELDPDERSLVAHGSVIGEAFAPAEAAALADRDPTLTARTLARLADRQYLDPLDGRYRFHHSLMRDVAYGRLLIADRLRLHARYAAQARTEDAEVIAHHWWSALGSPDAAWVWTDPPELTRMREAAYAAHMAAGARHAALFAFERAVALLERARTLAQTTVQRARATQAIGDAYSQVLRADEGWAAYMEALRAFREVGDVPPDLYIGALRLRLRIGAFRMQPSAEELDALAREAVAAARARGDPATLAHTLVLTVQRDMDPSTSAVSDPAIMAEALELAERSDPKTRRAVLGWYAADLLRQQAVDRAEVVLDQMETLPVPTDAVDRLEHLRARGHVARVRGDLAGLERYGEEMVALSRQMGPHLRTHADMYPSYLAFGRGDWRTVLALATDTERVMAASPTTAFCSNANLIVFHGALVYARQGRVDDGRALMRRLAPVPLEMAMTRGLRAAFGSIVDGAQIDWTEFTSAGANLAMYLALAAVVAGDAEGALDLAGELEARSHGGARLFGACAEAIREEVARDPGGPAPRHAALRAIGYAGWSEMLGTRRPATTS